MSRLILTVAVLALLAAACSSESDDAAATPVASDPTAPSDAPPTTDAASPGGGVTDLAITEVVFGDHVTITNVGTETITIDEVWLCNRPAYTSVAVSLAPGESQPIDAASLGGLGKDAGEVALYTSGSFDDPDAIVDYVGWGGGGGRASVALAAGIWPDGDTLEAPGAAIFAPGGGAAAADWSSQ
jgi:hypothetical protein